MALIYLRINSLESTFTDEIIETDTSTTAHGHGNYCSSKIPRFKKAKPAVFQEAYNIIHIEHSYTGSVPVSNLSYHPKIEDLCKGICPFNCCLDIVSEEDFDLLLSACNTKSIQEISTTFMKIDNLKNAFIGILIKNADQSVRSLSNRKHLFVSKLMQKSTDDLKNSQWCEIVTEFQKYLV